jgi:hypothetical protein
VRLFTDIVGSPNSLSGCIRCIRLSFSALTLVHVLLYFTLAIAIMTGYVFDQLYGIGAASVIIFIIASCMFIAMLFLATPCVGCRPLGIDAVCCGSECVVKSKCACSDACSCYNADLAHQQRRCGNC